MTHDPFEIDVDIDIDIEGELASSSIEPTTRIPDYDDPTADTPPESHRALVLQAIAQSCC